MLVPLRPLRASQARFARVASRCAFRLLGGEPGEAGSRAASDVDGRRAKVREEGDRLEAIHSFRGPIGSG
jgi:hypothetical protein